MEWKPPVDIISCEDEPIHVIGQIQSHGYLLAVEPTGGYKIVYSSENCPALFGLDTVVGVTLRDVDKFITGNKNEPLLTEYLNVRLRGENMENREAYKIKVNGTLMNLTSHKSGSYVVLELEPSSPEVKSLQTQVLLGEIMLKLNVERVSMKQMMQVIADELRSLLQFDRIMIYKFWPDWHGEVVAESKNYGLEPFLGLHYPASDIPSQARSLYLQNTTRLIADVNARPVPIHSSGSVPLDLTLSQVRAVSPIHIEYLKNMGVGASYSISLVVEDKLWGLIACHHYSPCFIDYEKRRASEIISSYLGNLLMLKNRSEIENAREKSRTVIDQLDNQMRDDWNVINGLTKHQATFFNLCDCEGGVISINDELIKVGHVPSDEDIAKIVNWLHENQKNDSPVFTTNHLSRFVSGLSKDDIAGLLAIAINRHLKQYILYFKTALIQQVTWAGKDEKGQVAQEDGSIRLSPRKSFDKWVEEVTGTSSAWGMGDIQASMLLREKVLSVLQLKANEVQRLNEKLIMAYEELDAFSYTLSHDLKTPLNTIMGYVELALDDKEDDPLLSKIQHNTKLMLDMIQNILQYSQVGAKNIEKKPVKIYPLLTEIATQMEASRKFSNVIIEVPEKAVVFGNKMMIYQVFLNLIENAIKYADPEKDAFTKVGYEEVKGKRIFYIEDNGIGIDPEQIDHIFGLFKRVSTSSAADGSGIGLAIVKKIIEAHDGKVWVESTIGKGSKFFILFNISI